MWSKLDDALLDHHKILDAGARLGPSGPAIAIGVFAMALMWTNKHLTDGWIPDVVIRQQFALYVADPIAVADVLTAVGLLERDDVLLGYHVHDFAEFNRSASTIKADRFRLSAQRAAAGRIGGLARAAKHGKANGKQDL